MTNHNWFWSLKSYISTFSQLFKAKEGAVTSSFAKESQSLMVVFTVPDMVGIETGTHSCVLQMGHIADRDPNMLLLLVLPGAPPDTETC